MTRSLPPRLWTSGASWSTCAAAGVVVAACVAAVFAVPSVAATAFSLSLSL